VDGDRASSRDHRMDLPAGNGRVRGGGSWGPGAEAEVSWVRAVDDLLIGVLAVHADRGRAVLGETGEVHELRGEPRAAAVVRAGPASGRGAGGGAGAGGRGERSRDAAVGAGTGRAARDVAGVVAAISRSVADAVGGVSQPWRWPWAGWDQSCRESLSGRLEALGAAWWQARRRFGGEVPAVFEFANVVSGGELLGTTTSPPWAGLGRTALMPPVPVGS